MSSLKKIKYRVSCEIHKLKINKNIDFETKIMWKRHQNKAETEPVKHEHGYSIFNQVLTLEFDMPYNTDKNQFESKNTEIVAVIVHQGKVKSGGYAKYNIADNLNQHPHQTTKVTIPMTQCPDPSSFLEASFWYESVGEECGADEMSILNVSSPDLNMSRVDFKDDRLSIEMQKINDIIHSFEDLAAAARRKRKDQASKVPELLNKLECLEGEKHSLLSSVEKLQGELQQKSKELKQQKKKVQVQTEELEKQLDRNGKDMKSCSKQNAPNYKQMYETAMVEIEQLRNERGILTKSMDLRISNNLEDVDRIADFSNKQIASEDENSDKADDLARQNVELQTKVASMSHKIAQLFNASHEYGGAKLLDYLQTSIGLTELQE